MNTAKVQRYRRLLYDPRDGWVNSHAQFAMFIRKRLRKDMKILDLGAGPGADARAKFRGTVASVVGVDLDLAMRENRHLDAAAVGSAEALPFSAESFDLVYSDWVVEHLPAPQKVVAEAFRVLKPGGSFIFRTGNLFHYVYAIAAFTPQWFHQAVANRVRGVFDDDEGIYETYYRMNTRRAVRRCFARVGFAEHQLLMVEPEPAYLVFSLPTFLLGVAYERVVNSAAFLAGMRANMFGCFVKPKISRSEMVADAISNEETVAEKCSLEGLDQTEKRPSKRIGKGPEAFRGPGKEASVGRPSVYLNRA